LAFDPERIGQEIVIYRLGILIGSLVSALFGYAVLAAVLPKGRAQGA
jgi:Na+/H+ antiporter NhaA